MYGITVALSQFTASKSLDKAGKFQDQMQALVLPL